MTSLTDRLKGMFRRRPTKRNNTSRRNTSSARPNTSSGRSSPAPAPATPNRSRGPKNSPLNELLRKYPSYTAQQLLANYQKRMQRRVQNMGHAEERIGLQIERLRKRPNLASHVAQAQRNLANAKRLSEAVRRQANNALRGVWSEGPITYHGPVHHRTGWTKGAWADTTRRTLASRQAARNRLLGNETLNRYHHNHKGAMNATQNALKALTNGTRPLHPMEAGLLLEQLERVENKYRTTGRLFAWERALLKDKALVKGMAHLMTTNNRPPPPSNNLTPNNLPHLLPLLHAAHNKAKKGLPLNNLNQAILARQNVLDRLVMSAAFNASPPPNTRTTRTTQTARRRPPTIGDLARAGHL